MPTPSPASAGNILENLRRNLAAKQAQRGALKAAGASPAPGVDTAPGSEHLSQVPAGAGASDPGAHSEMPAGARSAEGAGDKSKILQVGVPAGTPLAMPKEAPAIDANIEYKLAGPLGPLVASIAAGVQALKQAGDAMSKLDMPAANAVGDTKSPAATSPDQVPAGTPVATPKEKPLIDADIKGKIAAPVERIVADSDLYRKLAFALLATEDGRALVDHALLQSVGEQKAAEALAAIHTDHEAEMDKYAAEFSGEPDFWKLGQAMAEEAMLGELAGPQPVDGMNEPQLDMLAGAEQLGSEGSIGPEETQQLIALLIQALQGSGAAQPPEAGAGDPAGAAMPALDAPPPAAPTPETPKAETPKAETPGAAVPADESKGPATAKAVEGTDADAK